MHQKVRDTWRRGLWERRLALAGLGLALAGAALGDEAPLAAVADPRPVLQDLQRKMSSFRSSFLAFKQERHLKLFTEPLHSEGVMLIERPDSIRWETTAPYQSILLGARKSVAQFERTEGGWKKLSLAFPQILRRVIGQIGLMQQGKLEALEADFTISVARGTSATRLTLVPKDQNVRATMSSLEIRLLPDLSATREVVMNEPGGDFTRITFHGERRDIAFPAGTFDQSKPLDLATVRAALGDAP